MEVRAVALALLLVCLAACVLMVVLLVATRVVKDRADRRRLRLRGPVWTQVLVLTTGEDDEIAAAGAALRQVSRPGREAVAEDAFALVPKLRGAAKDRLRTVLHDWGLLEQSRELAGSRSVVRRCRGLHRLGVLGEAGSLPVLVAALTDRAFAVRRTALLALAEFPEAAVVRPALDAAVAEPRLRRDFLATMDRVGVAAVPVLREELAAALEQGSAGELRGYFTAEALGLTGAVAAVPALELALDLAGHELRLACLEALGDLGAPSSGPVVARDLRHASADVRRAAALALGRIGDLGSLDELEARLHDDHVEVARAAAHGLQQCGPRGREVLARSDSPLAREAVALARLAGAT